MVAGMAAQDEAWQMHVADAVETSSKEEFEQLLAHASGRMEVRLGENCPPIIQCTLNPRFLS